MVFGLIRPGLKPTIYQTRGEHANYYVTDEPTIYQARGEHANYYATDAVDRDSNLQHFLSTIGLHCIVNTWQLQRHEA
jgi:hypothetical protein